MTSDVNRTTAGGQVERDVEQVLIYTCICSRN